MSTRTFTLDDPEFAGRTGRGVRVAVIDSGIQPGHPHVAGALPGLRISAQGTDGDSTDRIGHGTAVAAAIREKAPAVELLPIRVFDQTLETTAAFLARGILAAAAHGARLINVSMGTTRAGHDNQLREALALALAAGALVVAPIGDPATPSFPGCMEDAAGVIMDVTCARDALRLVASAGRVVFAASGLPRPIPGVPPARNLHGASFAAANVTGFLARRLESRAAGEPVTAAAIVGDLMAR